VLNSPLLPTSTGGRPQWAKFYESDSFNPAIFAELYPKFQDFREVLHEVDPGHLFFNSFLYRVFPKEEQ
jgi:hypothetical protein